MHRDCQSAGFGVAVAGKKRQAVVSVSMRSNIKLAVTPAAAPATAVPVKVVVSRGSQAAISPTDQRHLRLGDRALPGTGLASMIAQEANATLDTVGVGLAEAPHFYRLGLLRRHRAATAQ